MINNTFHFSKFFNKFHISFKSYCYSS